MAVEKLSEIFSKSAVGKRGKKATWNTFFYFRKKEGIIVSITECLDKYTQSHLLGTDPLRAAVRYRMREV